MDSSNSSPRPQHPPRLPRRHGHRDIILDGGKEWWENGQWRQKQLGVAYICPMGTNLLSEACSRRSSSDLKRDLDWIHAGLGEAGVNVHGRAGRGWTVESRQEVAVSVSELYVMSAVGPKCEWEGCDFGWARESVECGGGALACSPPPPVFRNLTGCPCSAVSLHKAYAPPSLNPPPHHVHAHTQSCSASPQASGRGYTTMPPSPRPEVRLPSTPRLSASS